MIIAKVETYIAVTLEELVFRARTHRRGDLWVSEGSLNFLAKTVETAIQELSPQVIGMSPFNIEGDLAEAESGLDDRRWPVQMCALAAIEMACWDIMGKALNQPAYNLLGRPLPHAMRSLRERVVPRPAHARELR